VRANISLLLHSFPCKCNTSQNQR